MPSLVIHSSDGNQRSVPLTRPITRLGPSTENEIRLEDPSFGSGCLVLTLVGGRHQLSGLGVPFTVNGKVRDAHPLSDADEIAAGRSRLVYSTAAAARPAPVAAREAPARSAQAVDADEHTAELDGNVLRERQLLESLTRISRALLENYAIDPILAQLLDEAIRVTRADKGFLLLVTEGGPEVRAARNASRESIEDVAERMSDSIVQQVMETQEALIVSDALDDPKFSSSTSVMNLKVHSVMCVPLKQKGELIGLIYVGNDRLVNRFDRKAEEMLTIFAAQASLLIQNALLVRDLQLDNAKLRERVEQERFGEIIGACDGMQTVFRRIEKVAPADVTVLITGESGTGKELVALELHHRSARARGPFVTINCGAIPENLIESELFGHVRGAFTGAIATRAGKFQAANGGTLFLDEIGELPLPLQVKLLRALQERAIQKVGANHTEPVDIRVVAATNRNLEEEVKRGRFREDLLFRLNVVTLRLPPLRERVSDIHLLADFFLKRSASEFNSNARGFTKPALLALSRHDWPGNVRELENRVKRAVVLAEGAFATPEDLDLGEERLAPLKPLAQAKDDFQRSYINEALARNGGNRTKTAKDLGVDPRTIFRHLEAERDAAGEPPPSEDDD